MTIEELARETQKKLPSYNIVGSVKLPANGPPMYEIMATLLNRSYRLYGPLESIEQQVSRIASPSNTSI